MQEVTTATGRMREDFNLPIPELDSIEQDIVSVVTVGRRIHPPEVYRARVDSIQQRIRALPPLVQELLRARFTMEVSR